MVVLKSKLKKWGNSFGLIVPKEVLKREHINVKEEVAFVIIQKKTSRRIFGVAKDVPISGQELKDMVRRELHYE